MFNKNKKFIYLFILYNHIKMDYEINIISKKYINILKDKIKELINIHFIKLNIIHKNILVKYLNNLVIVFGIYYWSDNFVEQMYLNDYQDIFSLLVLLMPFYDLNKSKLIMSLDELFINFNSKAKSFESSYYIDHLDFKSNPNNYLEDYFQSVLYGIINTLKQVHCMILPNWLNIFPHTLDTYKTSKIYKNFIYLYGNKNFSLDQIEYNNLEEIESSIDKSSYFILDYHILYGTIYNFLYNDIKDIKWMIYDLLINNNTIIPNIIYIGNELQINNIIKKPWEKLDVVEKTNLEKVWTDFYSSESTNQLSLHSLVLFYLRWDNENELLSNYKIPKIIKEKLGKFDETNDEQDDNILYDLDELTELNKFLTKFYPKISFEKLYNYIYNSMHKFQFTWYGFVCLNDDKNILIAEDFYNKYFLDLKVELFEPTKIYYITPKNIYNFCKSLIHHQVDNNYVKLSNCGKWDNVTQKNKIIFIDRINNKSQKWFKITKNLQRIHKKNVDYLMYSIDNIFMYTSIIIDVVFQTLVYNGIFTYYKYNPQMTDTKKIPNKNTENKKWSEYILNNIDIKSYEDSYHVFSNTKLKNIGPTTICTIICSKWYTNFGANWIAQIQLYHHYTHNRVMFITGATGAGKSTVAPFLLVYAVKIFNYNNNAKVVCTVPRTQPVEDNALQISKNIGIPIIKKLNNELDNTNELYRNTKIGEAIQQDINYIQYKHGKGSLVDELYHPYLRIYTDGSLYNIIKQNYFFKKKIIENNNSSKQNYLKTNLFDIILVDEAHEHNTYMDMILTLSKFATYINNQVTLGIISATMDDDEITYRKYFQPIDNNWKAPLKLLDNTQILNYNYNYIDRRIHLSIPFGGMNFDVKEYPSNLVKYPKDVGTFTDMKKINKSVIEIVQHIISTSQFGDILIFQPGEGDIKSLVTAINIKTPTDVLALPFYSRLDKNILDNIVKKIQNKNVRKMIRYPKKYDITDIVPKDELLPEGTYKRFIIIATNIAEASITIDSLKFVIDTGNQKMSVYDPETNQDYLETRPIAVPNQKQRKGRVGRAQPGTVYYIYDRTKLGEKVVYKINIENIKSTILDLVTTIDTKLPDAKLFTEFNDPFKVSSYKQIPSYLEEQYTWINYKGITQLYQNTSFPKEDASKIIYPYSDGKYELHTLEDEKGEFFITHPNEDYFERNRETLEIIHKNVKNNYFNKITRTFEYGKSMDMIGTNNILTDYGILVNSISDFMDFQDNSIELTKIILDCYSLNISTDTEIYRNLIMFIVFKTTQFRFRVPKNLVGKADYLILIGLIEKNIFRKNLFRMIEIKDIYKELANDLYNYTEIVKKKVNILVNDLSFGFKDENFTEINNALISYYTIKLKIDIIHFNSKFLFKKEFDKIYELINKQESIDSNEYLFIVNKILLYYNESGELMEKSVINKFIDDLISLNNIFNKKSLSTLIDKIKNCLKTSLFKDESESLPKINLMSNKQFPLLIQKQFNTLSDYDKLCFIIIKNFEQNILVKIPLTDFYTGYYRKDINIIYKLEQTNFILNNKINKFIITKVCENIRNYYIFNVVKPNDNYDISNIMVLSELVINFLNNYFKFIGFNLFKKNTEFNRELAKETYTDVKFNLILKKIDKITKYIRNN